jgi:hypothetical protein
VDVATRARVASRWLKDRGEWLVVLSAAWRKWASVTRADLILGTHTSTAVALAGRIPGGK